MNFKVDRVIELLRSHQVEYKDNTQSLILTCPKCDREGKFYLRKKDGRYVCWSCKETNKMYGGVKTLSRALAYFSGLPNKEIIQAKILDDLQFQGMYINFPEDLPTHEEFLPDFTVVEYPMEVVGPDSKAFEPAWKYLKSRGIPETLIRGYQLRYHTLQRRVIFPMIVGGSLIGWQARATLPTEKVINGVLRKFPKMLSSPGLPRSQWVMFYDRLLTVRHALILEGPVDAIKCHLFKGNVASLGKFVTTGQLNSILELKPEKIYLGLDPDAEVETRTLVDRMFHLNIKTYIVRIPSHRKDLGECDFKEALQYCNEAEEISLNKIYFWGE